MVKKDNSRKNPKVLMCMEKPTLEIKQATESKCFQPYRELDFWSFGLPFSHPSVHHTELEKKKNLTSLLQL